MSLCEVVRACTGYAPLASRIIVWGYCSYAASTSPVGDTTCACAHYQFLRFPSLVPYIYTPCQRPRTNQRRTKERPKNSKLQKSTFVKNAVSFSSLIPCLITPTDDRENSERRAAQLLDSQKSFLLRSGF